MELQWKKRSFGGWHQLWRHESAVVKAPMEFAVFVPPGIADNGNAGGVGVPVLFYLSGLTCTWANASEKAGLQKYAAAHGVIVVLPDTSPRSLGLPGEDDSWDFGSGAGFYVNAKVEPWARHYRMFDYVTEELPELIFARFPADRSRCGVFGHSMGGHGALICALKRPDLFSTCSAFSPICAPSRGPWGQKALAGYLGDDRDEWKKWDACELAANSKFGGEVLADIGGDDEFLTTDLKPELLQAAFDAAGLRLRLRLHEHYDHSYYFIASFMADHFDHHLAGWAENQYKRSG